MFKKLALVSASAVLALCAFASGAHAEHWHGGWGGPRIVIAPAYVGSVYAAPYAPPCAQVQVWNGYQYVWQCAYAPPVYAVPQPMNYGYYGQPPHTALPPPIPSPCRMLAGDAVAGNGQPVCNH